MNTAIELHDSTVAELANRGDTVIVHFPSAYLHKSVGRPGRDAGSGWVQEARLVFVDASISGDLPELPSDLMDGHLLVGDDAHENEIPVPLESTTTITLHLVFDSDHTVTVTGSGVRLELLGEAKHIEEFTP